MIFAPVVDPATARQYFKKRVFQSAVVFSGIFLLLAVLFSWLASLMSENIVPFLLGNALAGLIAYYAFVIWNKQPMRIRCPNCFGIVLCKTPWVCGECGHMNTNVKKVTFLDECEECDLLPKSYVCHHCEKPIYLSEDRDATNPACRVNAQGHEPRRRSEKQQQKEEAYENKKRDIKQAKLVLTEEQIKAQIKTVKKGTGLSEAQMMTALDLQVESLKKFMDAATSISEAAQRQKALNAEECKNNPSERRKRDLMVDEWVRRQLSKGT